MSNIISYIEKLLVKPKDKIAPAADDFNCWVVIRGGDSTSSRIYNSANLWIVYNRFELNASERVETFGEYPLKNHNVKAAGLWGSP